ncbi:hypothetical protein AB4225_34325 [Streptomyces sp. 2RAF24]|uniref:hypothetical protein n=1 Tax=Streptomyces sp. 2RAF24 TaxID=3232997 RepID=UPI003F980902
MTVSGSKDNGDPRVDEQARERSAEQRNITAPTPPDVRDKAADDNENENEDGEVAEDGTEPTTP